jgi:hypothetical protein
MKAEPQKEHEWLHGLIGDWEAEMECVMAPGEPPMKSKGSESVRSLGGLWTLGEGTGEGPDGSTATTLMTLGYDPERKRFVGTFVASMMTHMWIYEGSVDSSGKVLTLDTEGPTFTGDGKMAKYQDIIEFTSPDHRTLTSRVRGEDGEWRQLVTAHYRRKK